MKRTQTNNGLLPSDRKRVDAYIPPSSDLISIRTIEELISGVRAIVPEQQARIEEKMALWCVGDTSLLKRKCVAIVGTRKVSDEGAARARRLARELVSAGIVVVSGLAKGVDTEALRAAIEHGGKVIAVIGTPVTQAYPSENKRLQERIYRDHLLVSQFAPGERVFSSNFPERNKLMAALSDATAIVEAGATSGTLHQAAECVRLRRYLFICKNVVENPLLEWPKKLLNDPNCITLCSTDDVLRPLGVLPVD